jgi:hypothetical protein
MSRRPRPFNPGALLLAAGSVLLFISLFLNWYEAPTGQPGRSVGLSAWTVFEVWDLVLAVLAVTTLAAAVSRFGVIRRMTDRWIAGPSAAAFVIVVFCLINHPPAALGRPPAVGIWFGLVATVLMLGGVFLSLANVSVAIAFADRPPAPDPGTARSSAGASDAGPAGGATAPTEVIGPDPPREDAA